MSQGVTHFTDLAATSPDALRARRRAILSCAVGNFVELFDFVIFGLFAAQLGANFFPAGDPVVSLLSAFATYGVGFVMRPVGAIVIGAYGDRHGRKTALIVTVGRDGRGHGADRPACHPTPPSASRHRSCWCCAGWCRASRPAANGAGRRPSWWNTRRPGRRGYIGSMQQFSVGLALIAATLSAAVLNSAVEQAGDDRLGLAHPVHLRLRAGAGRALPARPGAGDAGFRPHGVAATGQSRRPVRDSFTTYRRPVLAAFGVAIVGTVGNYIFNIFMPSFATGQLHLSASTAYYSTAFAAVVLTVFTPVMGMLSDKLGRKPVMLTSALGYVVLGYPLFLLPVDDEQCDGAGDRPVDLRPFCWRCMRGRSAPS